jgi:hypothetical protein
MRNRVEPLFAKLIAQGVPISLYFYVFIILALDNLPQYYWLEGEIVTNQLIDESGACIRKYQAELQKNQDLEVVKFTYFVSKPDCEVDSLFLVKNQAFKVSNNPVKIQVEDQQGELILINQVVNYQDITDFDLAGKLLISSFLLSILVIIFFGSRYLTSQLAQAKN